jgi:hypothetical protein
MLARPAAMATPPSTASPASWNPAVPPPPVTGASVGTGLGEGTGEGLSVPDSAGVAEELSVGLEVPPPRASLDADAPGALGDKTVTDEVGLLVPVPVPVPLDVQAESATQASMVIRPQPTAVSLNRCAVDAMAVRALIGPPHTPGNDHFPAAGRRNRRRKGKRVAGLWPLAGPAEELFRRKRWHHNGKARLRPKHGMACPPPKYYAT